LVDAGCCYVSCGSVCAYCAVDAVVIDTVVFTPLPATALNNHTIVTDACCAYPACGSACINCGAVKGGALSCYQLT
jgi:hypothetical protein